MARLKLSYRLRKNNYFSIKQSLLIHSVCHVRIQRGARGPDPPPSEKNTQKIGFLIALLVWIPYKTTKRTSQHSVLVHHQPASKTPFKWRFAGGPMMARLYWYLDPLSPNQLKERQKVGPPLKKLSGSAHAYQQVQSLTLFILYISK